LVIGGWMWALAPLALAPDLPPASRKREWLPIPPPSVFFTALRREALSTAAAAGGGIVVYILPVLYGSNIGLQPAPGPIILLL
jgi:hypothetical protein